MLENTKLAILGAGKMGEIIIRAGLDNGTFTREQVCATVKHESSAERLREQLGIEVHRDNKRAATDANIILVCVKPQVMQEVLEDIQDVCHSGQIVISVAASVKIDFIESHLKTNIPVIRAMPNTPCLIGEGMIVLSGGAHIKDGNLARARQIFGPVGRTMILDEQHMDAVTGLSASGPAFVYVMLESLAEGGVKVGLPRDVATELAAQTMLGASRMILETQQHPALLKDSVTTPAGCTIEGLLELEEGGLRVTLIKTVVRAAERAKQLIDIPWLS